MKIHPSAIIDPAAELADDVEIGPYSCIGGEVEIGPGTIVQSHVVIEGTVQIGPENFIGHGAIIGGTPQDLSFAPQTRSGIQIGRGNIIREHVTIHRGTAEDSLTTMGDRNLLMVGAHLGHNCAVANKVIIANNCLLAGYVIVEEGAFLGGGVTVHQFARVGQFAIAQGMSGVSKDLPPFLIGTEISRVAGVNVVGLRRAGFSAEERAEIRAAFRLLYESGLNVSQALAQAREKTWQKPAQAFFDFVAAAKRRGIAGLRRKSEVR